MARNSRLRKVPGRVSSKDQSFHTDKQGGEAYHEFLKAEYNNIAQAHFNTIQVISEFFRGYITIASLPISAIVIFLRPDDWQKIPILARTAKTPSIPLIAFGLVTLIGLLVLGYIVNLRCDALLYARTVNGIRKYFYEIVGFAIETENRFRVLPRRTQSPRYWEGHVFLFVVAAFATVGTAYWLAGLALFYGSTSRYFDRWFWLLVSISPLFHLGVYAWVTHYRETAHLKSRIIAIDIDGVLNDHRQHFCAVLEEQTGKKLRPEAITRIPVREIPGCNVTAEDERAVFNWPSYWTKMPEVAKVGELIKRIRNELGYNVWIFTYRPWPHPAWYPPEAKSRYRNAWNGASLWSRFCLAPLTGYCEAWLKEHRVPEMLGARPIRSMTKRWLREKEIPYDRLVVERGNIDARDPRFLTRNRFLIAAKKEIRAFVEDDLNKAKRLADVCDVVFLIDQPYNKADTEDLPSNIVRVSEWNKIHDYLRRVF